MKGASSAVGAVVVLIGLGLFALPDEREATATSFGKVPGGYGAFYDLLAESGLPVARSYAVPEDLDPAETVWWIAPEGLCADPDAEEPATASAALIRFVEAGGTAVILWGAGSCDEFAGLPLPPRSERPDSDGPEAASPSAEGEGAAGQRSARQRRRDAFFTRVAQHVTVSGVATPRRLDMRRARVFGELPAGFQAIARLGGEPFAAERAVGPGRLILVADSAFLENRTLDRADAAPLAGDFVRRYGAPLLDERQHGLRLPDGALRYLLASPARWVFLGLAVLGLLIFWWGGALQVAPPPAPETPAPSLAAFVGSLARLYRRSGDIGSVADRYRRLTLARVRRHFGLRPEADPDAILARLENRLPLSAETRSLLSGARTARDPRALRQLVRELDQWALEVCR